MPRDLLAALERWGGTRKVTARALGIGENTPWRKLKRYGMMRERKGR